MIKTRPSRALLGVFCVLGCAPSPAFAQPKAPPIKPPLVKAVPLSAPAYREKLQTALRDLRAADQKTASAAVKNLDAKYDVRRADGQIQSVAGNFWSNFAREMGRNGTLTPTEKKKARQALQLQIEALDKWTQTPVYQPADARKIILALEASGQIRTGPLWWQKALSDAWSAVTKAWQDFMKWLMSLFPTPTPLKNTRAPSDKWLWVLFYVFVTAILALLLWFAFRAFGGNLGRRNRKTAQEISSEDAALLQLPPQELLSRAEKFAAQGNFREALRHRYLSLLLDLDTRGVWRYDARRTNWEHIAALSRGEKARDLVAPLSDLTKRFDRVRYGGALCDDDSWRRFDGDARSFENQAATGHKSAAPKTEMVR